MTAMDLQYLGQSSSQSQLQAGTPHQEALQGQPAFWQDNKVHRGSCYEEGKCCSSSGINIYRKKRGERISGLELPKDII